MRETIVALLERFAQFRPEVIEIGGEPHVVMPTDWHAHRLVGLTAPNHVIANERFADVPSFVGYMAQYSDDTAVIFYDLQIGQFRAILDYHTTEGGPSWCAHRAEYTARFTPEWRNWTRANERWMTQSDFARFIEENLRDVAAPVKGEGILPAVLLDAALNLEAQKKVQFSESLRRENGQRTLVYTSDIQGTASTRSGKIDFPERFHIGIRPIERSDHYRIECRIEFRIRSGDPLALRYVMLRADAAVRDAFEAQRDGIAKALPDVAMYASDFSEDE